MKALSEIAKERGFDRQLSNNHRRVSPLRGEGTFLLVKIDGQEIKIPTTMCESCPALVCRPEKCAGH